MRPGCCVAESNEFFSAVDNRVREWKRADGHTTGVDIELVTTLMWNMLIATVKYCHDRGQPEIDDAQLDMIWRVGGREALTEGTT